MSTVCCLSAINRIFVYEKCYRSTPAIFKISPCHYIYNGCNGQIWLAWSARCQRRIVGRLEALCRLYEYIGAFCEQTYRKFFSYTCNSCRNNICNMPDYWLKGQTSCLRCRYANPMLWPVHGHICKHWSTI